jgi:thiamine-phosphate pyrophosphorylase
VQVQVLVLQGYYAILDVRAGTAVTAAAARAERLLAARPCALQIRAKGAPASGLRDLARAVAPLARAAGALLVVNDRLDVALAVGADLVHLGQEDLPLREARRLAGGRIGIGVSTHDLAQAEAAAGGGADYIGYGPVFETSTKSTPEATVGLAQLAEVAAAVRIPVVAIGGITLDRVAAVAAAGAAAAAVIAAIDAAPDPTAAGLAVRAAFASR